MRVYVNGIDAGEGRVTKNKQFVNVLYHEAMFPTCYLADRCVFTTRFGKRCMIYGGDYSEEEITEINKNYQRYLKEK